MPDPEQSTEIPNDEAHSKHRTIGARLVVGMIFLGLVLPTAGVFWVSWAIFGPGTECGRITGDLETGIDEPVGPDEAYIYHMYLEGLGPGDDWDSGPVSRDIVDPPLRNGEVVEFKLDDDFNVYDLRRSDCEV